MSNKRYLLERVLKEFESLNSLFCCGDNSPSTTTTTTTTNGEILFQTVLYNFLAVIDVRDMVPETYHIANEEDWADLLGYVGGMTDGGAKLKALLNWAEPNTGATDEKQFEAYPGGTRNADGTFADANYKAYFWVKNVNGE